MEYSHDKTYKHILSYHKVFKDFIEIFVDKSWKKFLDMEHAQKIDKSYVLPDFEKREGDLIYKIPIKREKKTEEEQPEVYLYILIEHQSTVDFLMPFRMLIYITELWKDIYKNSDEKKRKTKSFKLPPVFPIVLYNGEGKWTVEKNLAKLVDESDLFSGYFPNFSYYLIDASHYPIEQLEKMEHYLSSIFLLEHNIEPEKIFEIVKTFFKNLEKETDDEIFKALSRWMLYFGEHNFGKENIEEIFSQIESDKKQEGTGMIELIGEKLKNHWKQEGIKEGIKEGEIKGQIKGIETALDIKFGEDSLSFMPQILEINDLDKLTQILKAIKQAKDQSEFGKMLDEIIKKNENK